LGGQVASIRRELKRYVQMVESGMPRVMRHYRELRDSALEEGAVPLKVRELVAVGMAIARQC